MPDNSHSIQPQQVMTVQGPLEYELLGITDAHNHVWIEPVAGADPSSPVLDQFNPILQELVEYRQTGGTSLLDCQPGGCGRDGNKLLELSKASGVNIIACTGFHRALYYPRGYWMWDASAQQVSDYLCSELDGRLAETANASAAVKAGFIKIALEAAWADCPQPALEGTISAARQTGALIEIHTEKGALAERAAAYFTDRGLLPRQLVLCHMDKRPDISLHKALANLGVLLEYDTFYRPKYTPTSNVWPLVEKMVNAGHADRIALATDMADPALYHHIGGGPGLSSLPGEIRKKLREYGFPGPAIKQLLGGNIARRLAGIY